MAPEDTYSIAGFKEHLADCIEAVTQGRVIYIRNDKRRDRPVVAALVSPVDARRLESSHPYAQAP